MLSSGVCASTEKIRCKGISTLRDVSEMLNDCSYHCIVDRPITSGRAVGTGICIVRSYVIKNVTRFHR